MILGWSAFGAREDQSKDLILMMLFQPCLIDLPRHEGMSDFKVEAMQDLWKGRDWEREGVIDKERADAASVQGISTS